MLALVVPVVVPVVVALVVLIRVGTTCCPMPSTSPALVRCRSLVFAFFDGLDGRRYTVEVPPAGNEWD